MNRFFHQLVAIHAVGKVFMSLSALRKPLGKAVLLIDGVQIHFKLPIRQPVKPGGEVIAHGAFTQMGGHYAETESRTATGGRRMS